MCSVLSLEILKKVKKHQYMLLKLLSNPIKYMIVFLFNCKEYKMEKKDGCTQEAMHCSFSLEGKGCSRVVVEMKSVVPMLQRT